MYAIILSTRALCVYLLTHTTSRSILIYGHLWVCSETSGLEKQPEYAGDDRSFDYPTCA